MNYDGPSSGMEAELAVRALESLSKEYDIHGVTLISDGDSTLYARLRDELDWTIIKHECTNHLIKNYKSNLYQLKSHKDFGGILSELIINKICAYTRNVINLYGGVSGRDELKMKALVSQVPHHIFGYHKNCTEEMCKRDKDDANGDKRLSSHHFKTLSTCSNNIIFKVSRIYKGTTSNLAECYHSIRAKIDHGKVRNYIQRGSFQLRSYWAA